jgi:hypothetical protein
MQSNLSKPSAVPGPPKRSEEALLEETCLQLCIHSLQCIICDLLIENEGLRYCLAAEQIRIESQRSK